VTGQGGIRPECRAKDWSSPRTRHGSPERSRQQAPIVGGISDFAGSAELPDRALWNYPQAWLVKALELNKGGNVHQSPVYIVLAAIATRKITNLLEQYADDPATGAGRVIVVLKVAKGAGQVADVVLAIMGVTAIVRAGVHVIGGATAGKAAGDAVFERWFARQFRNDPEILRHWNKVETIPSPKGSMAGGVKPGTSSGAGIGFHRRGF